MKTILKNILLIGATLLPLSSMAFYSVQDTGDVIAPDEMQFLAELQVLTHRDTGANLIGRFDKGYDEDSNVRLTAGAGTTDFQLGAFFKWVPYPDLETQPAIGFIFGASFARYEDENELALRATPLVSKKYETDIGPFTPYAALPVALRNYNEDTELPINLAIGTRYKHPDFEHFDFTAEIGVNLNDSFGYISAGAIFPAFMLE